MLSFELRFQQQLLFHKLSMLPVTYTAKRRDREVPARNRVLFACPGSWARLEADDAMQRLPGYVSQGLLD